METTRGINPGKQQEKKTKKILISAQDAKLGQLYHREQEMNKYQCMCFFGPRYVCLTEVVRRRTLVQLRPIHPPEVFFSARSPSLTTAVVCWRSQGGQTHRATRPSWKRHHNHIKRKREYHLVVLKEEGDLKACVHGWEEGNIRQTHRHTLAYTQNMSGQVTSSKKKKAGNCHQNSCLPGIVSSVGVHVCSREREKKEKGCMWSCFWTIHLYVAVHNNSIDKQFSWQLSIHQSINKEEVVQASTVVEINLWINIDFNKWDQYKNELNPSKDPCTK